MLLVSTDLSAQFIHPPSHFMMFEAFGFSRRHYPALQKLISATFEQLLWQYVRYF